ncbi:methyltransferase family protein [Mesorhizobium sp. J18]|uniref:class I SAM-dependent methyltransferase n=1 Tax=Mesorhizobium sp. J18 TaxID=935263 RepID=UPI001199B405|nr:methyltransferase domain-containing protein [Mesorhizobium sp. J18]TWG90308.1 methyltransferase family protein [Mesorhizobium sp. J18]
MPVISPGNGLDVSRRAKSRRRFLARSLGGRPYIVLEIGALDNPTFMKSEGDVYFADFFSQQESVKRHIKSTAHNAFKIVDVDYVLRDSSLREAVRIPPDLIIANHVIEHIPNPIGWLQELREIVAPGGLLFLSVPDKRYTFDYFKPVSDAVDWIRAHDEALEMPSYYQILRHLYYHADITEGKAWSGDIPDDHMHRLTMPQALEKAKQLSRSYTDVHCSVFTYHSFRTIIQDLREADLINWKVAHHEDVHQGENEFRIVLESL